MKHYLLKMGRVTVGLVLVLVCLFPLLVTPIPAAAGGCTDCTWSPMTSGTSESLFGVWGTSSNDVFAVGTTGTILHYDGNYWRPMTSGTSECLRSVWGTSSSDVFAVGWDGTILRYDGNSWSPMTSGTTQRLEAVWGTSSSNVFAVGRSGTILHYDGHGNSWSPIHGVTAADLYGVWGTSSNDVFAVGELTDNGVILHYNGTRWDYSPGTILPQCNYSSVWGASSSDVFAVGYDGTIKRYDGSEWDTVVSGPSDRLEAVWGTSSSDVFAVGFPHTILHYDGNSWSEMISDTTEELYLWAVWGTSSSNVFAVGFSGTILHYGPPITIVPVPPQLIVYLRMLLADDAVVPAGGTVQVPIHLENIDNIASLGFNLSYDPAVARVTNVVVGSLLESFVFVPNYQEPGIVRFGYASSEGKSGGGWVAVVEFQAVGSEGDTSDLTLSELTATDASGGQLSIAMDHGVLTIGEREPGDSNGDGTLDEADAYHALCMYVKLEPEDLVVDMNSDGSVTPDDSRLILQQTSQRSS